MLKVTSLTTPSLYPAYFGARVCTATEAQIADPTTSDTSAEAAEFLQKLIAKGHESVLEHVNFTFFVEGLSRACLQELARHRHISLSVKSTRWALKRDYKGRMQSSFEKLADATLNIPANQKLTDKNSKAGVGLALAVANLLDAVDDAVEAGFPNDYIKYHLPECFTTDLVLTVNARELRHIFKLRAAPNALLEFNELCINIRRAIRPESRVLFEDCADWDATIKRVNQNA